MHEKSFISHVIKFQGISLDFGAMYSRAVGREDSIYHEFGHYSENPEDREIVVVDRNTEGTVMFSSPSTPEKDNLGNVYYPYIDFLSFSSDSSSSFPRNSARV